MESKHHPRHGHTSKALPRSVFIVIACLGLTLFGLCSVLTYLLVEVTNKEVGPDAVHRLRSTNNLPPSNNLQNLLPDRVDVEPKHNPEPVSNAEHVPAVVKAFRKAKIDWHDLLPQHNSILERFGNSEDPQFQFMKLVLKEQALTDFLTQHSATNGIDHGALTAYHACNLLADPCMVHDNSSCMRDHFCAWNSNNEVCELTSRQEICPSPSMFSSGSLNSVKPDECKRFINQPVVEVVVTSDEGTMFYHWFEKFQMLFQEWKQLWGRRDVHYIITMYPHTSFFDYFGLLSDNCWRRAHFIPEGTCFCAVEAKEPRLYRTEELTTHMLDFFGIPDEGPPSTPTLGLISRRNKRFILNQDDLVNVARDLGYDVIVLSMESLPLYQQLLHLRRVTVLAGVHGSGLSNGLLMRPGSTMLQLLPYHVQFRSGFPGIAQMANLVYRELAVQRREDTVVHWEFVPQVVPEQRDAYLNQGSGEYENPDIYTFWINQDSIIDPQLFKETLVSLFGVGINPQPHPNNPYSNVNVSKLPHYNFTD